MSKNFDCALIHPFLKAGICVYCKRFYRDGTRDARRAEDGTTCLWYQEAFADWLSTAALCDFDKGLAALAHSGAPTETLLWILAKAICDPRPLAAELACQSLLEVTWDPGDEEVRECESALDKDPQSIVLRALLIKSYNHRDHTESDANRHAQHVLWLIRNLPESSLFDNSLMNMRGEDLEDAGKAAWMEQISRFPDNPRVFGHAAIFFRFQDRALSIELLERARTLEPENREWSDRIGQAYLLATFANTGEERKRAAQRSFAELHAVHQKELLAKEGSIPEEGEDFERYVRSIKRQLRIPALAKMAFEASDEGWARKYAEDLLTLDDTSIEFVDSKHQGHLVLGRLAFRSGNHAGSRRHLRQMGEVKSSPVLSSFGPNMQLAKELLEAGEKEAVLNYLDQCRSFWTSGLEALSAWSDDIRNGRVPDFGSNLLY